MKYLVFLALGLASQQLTFSGEMGSAPRPGGKCAVWGRVVAPPYLIENGLELRIDSKETEVHEKVPLAGSTFELKTVPPGSYYLRVMNRSGQCLLKSTKKLKGAGDYLLLRFRLSTWEPLSGNMVSVKQLGHEVPAKAIKAERDARNAAERGNRSKAVRLLEKAVALDPGFAEAHLELAVNYYHLGQKDAALESAQTAYASDPESVDAGQVLGMILYQMNRYRDAEAVARSLLRAHSDLGEVQGLLAVSMIGGGRDIDEAFEHLKLAAATFPLARSLAAEVLMERGHYSLAIGQLQTFINSSASECERLDLENWIAELNARTGPASQARNSSSLSGGGR